MAAAAAGGAGPAGWLCLRARVMEVVVGAVGSVSSLMDGDGRREAAPPFRLDLPFSFLPLIFFCATPS